ncbi:MAG: hypothetical protein HQL51_05025 [Magnetococcales bacterium]|nr:hypothetical protein [Magnetococcales bacterium]
MLGVTHCAPDNYPWILRLAAAAAADDAATENGYRAQRELALRYVITF